MIGNWLLLCGLVGPIGPVSPGAVECFDLVKRFDPVRHRAATSVRDRIEKELTDRPDAVLAVLWGSQHRNADISSRCTWILHVWKTRRDDNRYREIVRAANGDLDRFLNSLLYPEVDADPFAKASEVGRAFDRYFVKNSFPSFTAGTTASPFHEYAEYRRRPSAVVLDGFLENVPKRGSWYLALCDGVDAHQLSGSIVLSKGDVSVRSCTTSVIVSGGDFKLDRGGGGNFLVFAAGDVTLTSNGRVMVIAGGKVTLKRGRSNVLIVTPKKLEDLDPPVGKGVPALILDGKPKPAPDLFTFRDLWVDYGVRATLADRRVKIDEVKETSPFRRVLQEGDVILTRRTQKITSTGQLRRLLRLSLDTGRFEFTVERSGKELSVEADLGMER